VRCSRGSRAQLDRAPRSLTRARTSRVVAATCRIPRRIAWSIQLALGRIRGCRDRARRKTLYRCGCRVPPPLVRCGSPGASATSSVDATEPTHRLASKKNRR